MIAVVLIATGGEAYTRFVAPLAESLRRLFPPHDVVLFTDSKSALALAPGREIAYPNLGWPNASLLRYHAMFSQRELLQRYDHTFFMDTDMLVVNRIEAEDILADGITATLHPGFPADAFERRPASAAHVYSDYCGPYYQACFIGGSSAAFIEMCEVLKRNIDQDATNGVVACYFDESHLNCYLAAHPPAKVLSPAYAFPAPQFIRRPELWYDVPGFEPKIRHIYKPDISGTRVW